MAGGKSDYLETTWFNFSLRGSAFSSPTTVYLALYTSSPSDSSAGTEVATAGGTSYVRQAITFGAPSNSSASNSGTVTFPIAGASWGTIVAWAITDSATYGAGNQLYWGSMNTNRTINTGEQITFPTGQITVGES